MRPTLEKSSAHLLILDLPCNARYKAAVAPTQMLHPVNGGPNFTSAYGSCSGECAGKGCAIGCAFATLTSADGIHFTHKSNSGEMGDRSSFYWDSFRRKVRFLTETRDE